MWKFLLAIVILQFVLAFICFAIVRVGSERYSEDTDQRERLRLTERSSEL